MLARWREEVFSLLVKEAQAELAAKQAADRHAGELSAASTRIEVLTQQAADQRAELELKQRQAAGLSEQLQDAGR